MDWRALSLRIGLLAGLAPLASSCVPSAAEPTSAPKGRSFVSQDIPSEPTVAAAEPLLRRLDLQVAPADLPPFASDALASGQPLASGPSFLDSARSLDDAERAITCMTAAIYYEAASEPLDGQRAVAQVVMNRVRDRAFPNSVCGVVWQGSNRRTGCQFSFTCDGSLNRMRDPIAWARARNVATAALNGAVDTAVGAATHYHTTAILPWWAPSLRRIGVIGHHIFYRWAAPLERALSYRQAYTGVEPGVIAAASITDPAMTDTAALLDGAAAPDAMPQMVQGVAIHRVGDAIAHGVRVHRGTMAAAGEPPAVAAAPTSATAGSGVQVHRGTPPAPPPAAAPAASTSTAG